MVIPLPWHIELAANAYSTLAMTDSVVQDWSFLMEASVGIAAISIKIHSDSA
ncbi:MAG: hypothetical protein ACLTEE_15300 [Anaerobutyricum hallii]